MTDYPVSGRTPDIATAVVPHGLDSGGNAVPMGQTGVGVATIPAGGSLSGAIDLATQRLAGIAIPAAWSAANLTFQASTDGATFNDLYDWLGGEYTVQVGGPARHVQLPLADFLGLRHLKIRSGTAAAPVNQAASRTLTLVLVS